MRKTFELTVALTALVAGAVLPSAHGEFKQLALAIHNYQGSGGGDVTDLLFDESREKTGILILEDGEVVDAVAVSGTKRGVLTIELTGEESVEAFIISDDDVATLLMDEMGAFALFVAP